MQEGFWARFWRRPQRWFLFGIPLGGFVAFIGGIVAVAIFFGGLHHTETLEFCTSCHEMQQPYEELKATGHHSNRLGIQPDCASCHVPPTFFAGVMRHLWGVVEVWSHLTGDWDTPEKFEARRLEMAQATWAELKANDSAQCRSCHTLAAMALDKQDPMAAKRHAPEYIAKTGKTCIDCHQGVAHKLPAGA